MASMDCSPKGVTPMMMGADELIFALKSSVETGGTGCETASTEADREKRKKRDGSIIFQLAKRKADKHAIY